MAPLTEPPTQRQQQQQHKQLINVDIYFLRTKKHHSFCGHGPTASVSLLRAVNFRKFIFIYLR